MDFAFRCWPATIDFSQEPKWVSGLLLKFRLLLYFQSLLFFQNWVVIFKLETLAYFNVSLIFEAQIVMFHNFKLCNFLVRTLQCTESILLNLFWPWKHTRMAYFFSYCPDCPKRTKIENSGWKYDSRYVCLLICGCQYSL